MRLIVALRRTWDYRGYVLASVVAELRARYSNSLLGLGWALIHPFSLVLLYTVVFANAMRPVLSGQDHPLAYSVYLGAGIVVWNLFSELLGRCAVIFVANSNLLKKVSFPKLTLPLIAILSSLVNFAILFTMFVILLPIAGFAVNWSLLATLPVLAILLLLATGLGLLAGVVNVFYRDVGQILTLVLQFWFWFTPIVYTSALLPPRVAELLLLNPLRPIVLSMQGIFLEGRAPVWSELWYPLALALILLAFALLTYQRLGDEIVDEL